MRFLFFFLLVGFNFITGLLAQSQSLPATLSNVCPVRTADLTFITPSSPAGLEWHTVSVSPSSATRLSNPASVGAGTYTLFSNLNGVYTLLGQTTVNLTECTPQPAFSCPSGALVVEGAPSDGLRLDVQTGSLTLERNNIIAPGSNRQIQAIGYNPLDNYLYGYRTGTSSLVRIGSDWSYQFITIGGLPVIGYDSGDIGSNGILYLTTGSSVMRRVDLNPQSPTYLQLLTDLPISGSTFSDWAVSPLDGNLYAVNQSGTLLRYSTTTGTRTILGTVSWNVASSNGFGGCFFDQKGTLYLMDNNTGGVYTIIAPHLLHTNASISGTLLVNTGVTTSSLDAAFCRSASPCSPLATAGVSLKQPRCTSPGSLTVLGYNASYEFSSDGGGSISHHPPLRTCCREPISSRFGPLARSAFRQRGWP